MKKSTKIFKCSDPSQNLYGFSVLTAGIKLGSFNENPVCLLNHNYDKVMGYWEDVQSIGNNLQGVPVFDTEDPEVNKYYGQVERGVIKGASIGIIPISVEADVVTSCELLEISITPVPANRNAIVMYSNDGLALSAEDARNYVLSINNSQHSFSKENDKILALIDNGINNNILAAETRPKWIELAKKEPLVALSVLGALIESNISILSSEITNKENRLNTFDVRQNWSFDDYANNDPVALLVMQEKYPEQFATLYAYKAKQVRLMAQIPND